VVFLIAKSASCSSTSNFFPFLDESDQLCFLEHSATEFLNHPAGTKELAALFGLSERTVRKSFLRGPTNLILLGGMSH
jgi:hypothetical protein